MHYLSSGSAFPLGATYTATGVNFSVYSQNASSISLLLFDHHAAQRPSMEVELSPHRNRTFYYWHIFVHNAKPGQLYAWRVNSYADTRGYERFFDSQKVLLDPYARAVMYDDNYSRSAACKTGVNMASSLKSVVVDLSQYDWENDEPLNRPLAETILYETHLRGFTRHPSSGVKSPGTYAGLTEKLPYLQSLGITALELLPVYQYDWQDVDWKDPVTGRQLSNFWGYQPIAYFAPHRGYCTNLADPLAPVNEFRDMVKACHRAGIEVILDVVYNHTAEGGAGGPVLSFRGLDDYCYYLHDGHDRSRYIDFTGCGNTLNANNSVVRRLIMDSLRYWVQEMHVDGFRFDLASALTRNMQGNPLSDPPLTWEIETDPILANTKIIAEPWDAAGLYQVGQFPGNRWAEENGRYRDNVRRFVKGDYGTTPELADRLLGSANAYDRLPDSPHRSINYIAGHDGFTMLDLVSYNHKHNENNGENNRDGSDGNFSWNHGFEGLTTDYQIAVLRSRQIKNFMTLLFVSQGVPRLLAGDELCRTQNGNNNAYCQDNEISWIDWRLVETYADMLAFVRALIKLRREMPVLRYPSFLRPDQVTWHGVNHRQPDWSHHSTTIALTLHPENEMPVHIIANAHTEALKFEVPRILGRQWRAVVDTSRISPNEFLSVQQAPKISSSRYLVHERSVVVLVGVETRVGVSTKSFNTHNR